MSASALMFAIGFSSILVSIRAASIVPITTTTQMSVTPPFQQTSCYSNGENSHLADISSPSSSSLYNMHCSRYRKCFPPGIKDNFFLPRGFPDFQSIESSLSQGFMASFNVLLSRNDDDAKNCLHYGLFFICNAYYPMCIGLSNDDDPRISPCLQLCESTLSHCRKALPSFDIFFNTSAVFECNQYQSFSNATTNCLAEVTDGCNSIDAGTVASSEASIATAAPTTEVRPTTAAPTTEVRPTTAAPTETLSTTAAPTEAQPTSVVPTNTTNTTVSTTLSCKKPRDSYSRGVILEKDKYKFLVFVQVLEKFTAMVDDKRMIAYNATLLKDFDLSCSATHVCNQNVTIYTTDDDDCNRITDKIDSVNNTNIMIAGGKITDKGQLVLDGYQTRCVISPYKEGHDHKISKINRGWLKKYTCSDSSAQRNACGV